MGLIIDNGDPRMEEIESLMESYSENYEVPEYEDTCDCVGSVARCHAYIIASKYLNKKGEVGNSHMNIWHKEYNSHWLRDEPEKNCDCCRGLGVVMSTDNPDGKWDWFVVGGRWYGKVAGIEFEDVDIRSKSEIINDNILSVKDYIKLMKKVSAKVKVYTILLPNKWIEVSKLSNSEIIKLLLPYKDQWMVGLDYHN